MLRSVRLDFGRLALRIGKQISNHSPPHLAGLIGKEPFEPLDVLLRNPKVPVIHGTPPVPNCLDLCTTEDRSPLRNTTNATAC